MKQVFWPDHQIQLQSQIINWQKKWSYIPPEKDSTSKQMWIWTAGQWIEYSSQSDATQLGEVPFPIFSHHLEEEQWNNWLQMATQNWGEPNKSRIIQYEIHGGELFILPNGKQYVQKNEKLWGGRLGEYSSLFYTNQWTLKNERFPMEQHLDQRTEVQQYSWEKHNQPQFMLAEHLEEKGAHWYSCQVQIPHGCSLEREWKQWLQWGGEQYKARDVVKSFWGDYELKTNNGIPFMAYAFS